MKKLISIALLLAMCLGLFAGCGDSGNDETKVATDLESAKEYLTSMYQTAGKGEAIEITEDKDVLKSVVVAAVTYSVDWTVEITSGAADSVSVGESTKENHVKLDIPLHSGEDILFTATATITDPNGDTATVSFDFKVAGVQLAGDGMTMEELVEAAYALEEGASMEGLAVLTGKVTMINTPYDEGYKNVTVTIQVGELSDKVIKCYRLKGDGAETLGIGDTVTVSGTLINYNGSIQFDAGCLIDELVKSTEPAPEAPTDPKQIVEEAYALADNAALAYSATLTGIITSIDTPYDSGYQNITVTMTVEGCEDKPIKCYRLKGTGADTLAVGDTITVTGNIVNYNGTVEFGQGCNLDVLVKGDGEVPVAPADPKQIVAEAYALEEGAALAYNATLTGVITTIDTPYDSSYQNITVTITVEGCEDQPIKCYRLKGDGADALAVGDTITVTGIIKNYSGTVEFDAGCALTAAVNGEGGEETDVTEPVTQETEPDKILEAAKQLAENEEMSYDVTLTGKVTAVDDAYSEEYQNITVTVAITGTRSFLKFYRLKGTGVDQIAVGDTITATGRIKNYYGELELTNCTMTNRTSGGGTVVKAETEPTKIVDAAYALSENEQLAYDAALTGKVTAVNDAYSADYQNITVTIQVTGRESKPIVCYRMKGDGVDKIAVGDTITVTGRLKNYNGTVEFDTGCQLTNRVSGGGSVVVQETDPAKIMTAAGKLAENEEMSYDVTLSGKVTAVDDAYSEEYQNVTVTVAITGTRSFLKFYRLKGDGVDQIAVGDTITATGRIKNYYGEIELTNCTMSNRVSGGGTAVKVETEASKIIDAAYALAENTELAYDSTLTGKVTSIDNPYDTTYQNITVTIKVTGSESKPIVCYRLKGDGADQICVGDTITVEGRLKNYSGTVEFDSGCQMTKRVSGGGTVVTAPTDHKQIVAAAYALEPGASLPYRASLTGKITSIDTPYDSSYKNITVTIIVSGCEDQPIKCYRLKGDGAENLKVGDTITVTGVIKNYQHSSGDCEIEFDSGCTLG